MDQSASEEVETIEESQENHEPDFERDVEMMFESCMRNLDDLKAEISKDKLPKDVDSAKALIERHQNRRNTIDACEHRFVTTIESGRWLPDAGAEVEIKLNALKDSKSSLLTLCDDHHDLYIHDDDTERKWMEMFLGKKYLENNLTNEHRSIEALDIAYTTDWIKEQKNSRRRYHKRDFRDVICWIQQNWFCVSENCQEDPTLLQIQIKKNNEILQHCQKAFAWLHYKKGKERTGTTESLLETFVRHLVEANYKLQCSLHKQLIRKSQNEDNINWLFTFFIDSEIDNQYKALIKDKWFCSLNENEKKKLLLRLDELIDQLENKCNIADIIDTKFDIDDITNFVQLEKPFYEDMIDVLPLWFYAQNNIRKRPVLKGEPLMLERQVQHFIEIYNITHRKKIGKISKMCVAEIGLKEIVACIDGTLTDSEKLFENYHKCLNEIDIVTAEREQWFKWSYPLHFKKFSNLLKGWNYFGTPCSADHENLNNLYFCWRKEFARIDTSCIAPKHFQFEIEEVHKHQLKDTWINWLDEVAGFIINLCTESLECDYRELWIIEKLCEPIDTPEQILNFLQGFRLRQFTLDDFSLGGQRNEWLRDKLEMKYQFYSSYAEAMFWLTQKIKERDDDFKKKTDEMCRNMSSKVEHVLNVNEFGEILLLDEICEHSEIKKKKEEVMDNYKKFGELLNEKNQCVAKKTDDLREKNREKKNKCFGGFINHDNSLVKLNNYQKQLEKCMSLHRFWDEFRKLVSWLYEVKKDILKRMDVNSGDDYFEDPKNILDILQKYRDEINEKISTDFEDLIKEGRRLGQNIWYRLKVRKESLITLWTDRNEVFKQIPDLDTFCNAYEAQTLKFKQNKRSCDEIIKWIGEKEKETSNMIIKFPENFKEIETIQNRIENIVDDSTYLIEKSYEIFTEISDTKENILNLWDEFTEPFQPKVSESGDILVVIGVNVRISAISALIKTGKIYVFVFALHKLIIDDDFNVEHAMLIASVWQVNGKRNINAAGNFIGIYKRIIRDESSEMQANVRNDDVGQRSGNCEEGVDEISFVTPKMRKINLTDKNGLRYEGGSTFLLFMNQSKEGMEQDPDNRALCDDHSHMANVYECLLREQIAKISDDSAEKSNLKMYLDILENDGKFQLLYADTHDLFDDFESLYKQFHSLKNKGDFIQYFKSLQQRVSGYEKKLREKSKDNPNAFQDKFVELDFLQSKIDSEITNIEKHKNESIHHSKYVNLSAALHEAIVCSEKVNDFHTLDRLRQLQNEYKQGWAKKINSAKKTIENDILPKLKKIFKETVEKVRNDILMKQEELQDNIDGEEKRLNTLQNSSKKRLAINAAKVIRQTVKVMSVFGPLGEIIGEMISSGTIIAVQEIQKLSDPIQHEGLDLFNDIKTLCEEYEDDQAKIKAVNDAISKYQEGIKLWEDFAKQVNDIMIRELEHFEIQLKEYIEMNNDQTLQKLCVRKFALDKFHSKFRQQVDKMCKESTVYKDIENYLNTVIRGLKTIIEIYGYIENYKEKIDDVDYQGKINSNGRLNESVLISRLGEVIETNNMMDLYKTSIRAFVRHYFPFVPKFEPKSSSKSKDTKASVVNAIQLIKDMQTKHEGQTTFANGLIRNVEFGSDQPSFYVWEYENHRTEIDYLLKGGVVQMNADIMRGVDEYAIKFKKIEIRLKAKNAFLQEQLNAALENCRVKLICGTDHRYRYGEKVYLIPMDDKLIFQYKIKNGCATAWNALAEHIGKENDCFLSPYNTWSIKLNGGTGLENFKDVEIDLELIGEGQYIEKNQASKLSDYYDLNDSMIVDAFNEPIKIKTVS